MNLVYSAAEVAAILGVNIKTLYSAAERGEVPCLRIGRRVIFPREAIDRWFAGQSTT